jgi:serine/threonine protein kinase
MTLTAGTRLGPYEILAPLGAGGMGEVWRGRDTRLERSVAIKVLPAEFATNAQLKLRFEREAKTISQLNHPHICTLYDVGDGYLVMELLEGETLADRVARGPLPVAEVLKYGAQIAEALDKAHKAGVVHRDLKPGNIMITKSGAKLLDFGLAKGGTLAIATEGATDLRPLTAEGAIVGTFQYMAPEQLEGAEADARTDIFAFGAVLYEMATGKRAFQGKTRTSLIAAIVSGEPPPLSQFQPLAPAALERVIRKCLEKDPDDRWQCAADLRWELLSIQQESSIARPARSSLLAWIIAGAALVAVGILAAIALRPGKAPQPIRFSITPPAGWTFSLNYNLGPPAVSPNGRYAVIPATNDLNGRSMLWIRDLSASEPTALAETEGAGFPFWSADSASVAFFAGGFLKRLDLSGGSPQMLCPAAIGRGGSWSQNNDIVFAQSGNGPLYRVSARGGTPQQVTRLDKSKQEASHRWPVFLPDGKHFLFLNRRHWTKEHPGDEIYVGSLDSSVLRLVTEASSNIVYTEPGYLLFLRDRTLVAQRFNSRTFQLEGEPRAVIRTPMQYHPAGFGLFGASRSGVLVYGAGSVFSTLAWIDRQGRTEPMIPASADYLCPRLTADQRHVIYSLPDPTSGTLDVWLYDVQRRVSRRVTYHPRDELQALVTPDGNQLVYSSNRSGFPNLFIKPVEGSDEKLLVGLDHALFAESISADGKNLLFREVSASSQNDIYSVPLAGGKPTPFLASDFNEVQSTFSPTGKWVAYSSNESGQYEVYACRYPGCGSRVQISTDGGSQPTWRGDEKELFYIAPGGWMMSVPIDTSGGVLKPGTPARVTQVLLRPPRDEEREYDVSADGRRFLINSLPADKRSFPITVVVNWLSELENR